MCFEEKLIKIIILARFVRFAICCNKVLRMICKRMSSTHLLNIIHFIRVQTDRQSPKPLLAVKTIRARQWSISNFNSSHRPSSTSSALVVLLLRILGWCIDHHFITVETRVRVSLCLSQQIVLLALAAASPDTFPISLCSECSKVVLVAGLGGSVR